jgi:hypothetical protein
VFDLGRKTRVVFAAVYVVAQGALVLTAARRPDHAFGFQMFSEASTMEVHLSRKVVVPADARSDASQGAHRAEDGTVLVPVTGGTWKARDANGDLHRFAWRDRVKDPVLANLDVQVFASYGAPAQLFRLQAALDDVARHTPEDAETLALVADVDVRRNGHEPIRTHLVSAPRPISAPSHGPRTPQ